MKYTRQIWAGIALKFQKFKFHATSYMPILLRGHPAITWTEIFFDPPPPLLRGQFLYPERGQKQTFFDPLLILST